MTDEEFNKLFPKVKWPKTVEREDRTQIVPPLPSSPPRGFFDVPLSEDESRNPYIGGIDNYIPSPREKLAYFLNETFFGDDRAGLDRAEFLLRPIDVSPAAVPFAAYDATRAIGEGRYKSAILPILTAAAPFFSKPAKVLSEVKPLRPGESFVESLPSSARIPTAVFNAERPIAKEFDQTIANNNIGQAFGNGSSTIKRIDPSGGMQVPPNAQEISANVFSPSNKPQGRTGDYPLTGQSAEGIPRQTFLTKGLENKRHNYSPDMTIVDGAPKQTFLTEDLKGKRHNYPPDQAIVDDESAMASLKPRNQPPRIKLFYPPSMPQRPFEADYPTIPAHDETGKLLVDIDGAPINAQYVAGRRTLGGDDIGLTDKEIDEIARKLTKVEMVPQKDMGGPVGKMRWGKGPRDVEGIQLVKELPERHKNYVRAHELGHAMHRMAGFPQITDPRMRAELERNYSRMRTGIDTPEKLMLPPQVSSRYSTATASDRELVAHGYHSALADPNYAKTMLPISAPILREWIKSNPELAKWVIMNGVAATTVAAALGEAGKSKEAKAALPPKPQGNPPGNQGSLPGTFVPFGLGGEAAKASAYGLAEITKALSRRGLYPQAPKNEKFKDLVQALANLKARRDSQSYGGPK